VKAIDGLRAVEIGLAALKSTKMGRAVKVEEFSTRV
jgi:hypothetical protein